MRRFTALFQQLDRTTRTNEKVAALRAYFEQAPPADAAWAVAVLSGRKLIRAVSSNRLRDWASQASGYPGWLIAECYRVVGDLSETLALLIPDRGPPSRSDTAGLDEPLHAVVERRILPLEQMDEAEQRALVVETWRAMNATQRFVYHKLISTSFRVGVSRKLVTRALAEAAGVDPAVMAHRLSGRFEPSAAAFERLMSGEQAEGGPGRPYPFFLAHPLEDDPDTLGEVHQWQVEWKWDGIRAQLIHRRDEVMLWTRGEELVTDAFPELRAAGENLDGGTVLDGEIVAWEGDRPLPFAMLQRRLNRKRVEPMLFADVPIVFIAFDLLEAGGEDQRGKPLEERRRRLEQVVAAAQEREVDVALRCSPTVALDEWGQLEAALAEAGGRRVEGLMLKRRNSAYGVGRTRGDWWKWKVDPFTIDAVLVQAEHGHGQRAGLFTDYTFAVWRADELVPIAKAYSGLSNEQIEEVDQFVRQHTVQRYGPVTVVKPLRVFELAFERVQRSTRHKAGLAVRFPRIVRPRPDKSPAEADRLETLEAMLDEG